MPITNPNSKRIVNLTENAGWIYEFITADLNKRYKYYTMTSYRRGLLTNQGQEIINNLQYRVSQDVILGNKQMADFMIDALLISFERVDDIIYPDQDEETEQTPSEIRVIKYMIGRDSWNDWLVFDYETRSVPIDSISDVETLVTGDILSAQYIFPIKMEIK